MARRRSTGRCLVISGSTSSSSPFLGEGSRVEVSRGWWSEVDDEDTVEVEVGFLLKKKEMVVNKWCSYNGA